MTEDVPADVVAKENLMETPTPEPSGRVPDELIDELHGANQKFHEARVHLEEQMDGTEHRHQERVDAAASDVREAEQKLEAVSDQISQTLHADPANPPPTPPPGTDARSVRTDNQ